MKRLIIISLALLTLTGATARQKAGQSLAHLLEQCLSIEDIHPDSLYPNLRMLETRRNTTADPTEQTVYDIVLGRLYAERSWRGQGYDGDAPAPLDSLQEWTRMDYNRASARHFGEAFRRADLLYAAKAEQWLPLTEKGNATYANDLLGIAWRTMENALGSNLRQELGQPSYAWIIGYYEQRGNREAALQLSLDSLLASHRPVPIARSSYNPTADRKEALKTLAQRYADVPMCAEVYLQLSELGGLTPQERRAYLQEGMRLYPKYKRISALSNALLNLHEPMMEWTGQQTLYPGRTYDWQFEVRNVPQTRWTLYRLPDGMKDADELKDIYAHGTKVQDGTHPFRIEDPILTVNDTLRWTAPAQDGRYALIFSPVVTAKTTEQATPMFVFLKVTRKKTIDIQLPDGAQRCEAVDAVSGAPLGCDCDPDDLPKSMYRWGNSKRDTTTHIFTSLFTDRSIYRPGQKVYVSGLSYERKDWTSHTRSGQKFTIRCTDSKRKTIFTQEVTSDEFGVFSTELQLPDDEIGFFTLTCGTARQSIRVEEYKRPTFEVTFDPVPQVNLPIDSLTLSGTALRYNGTPVRNAQLTGHYEWQPSRWCWMYNETEYHDIDSLQTDDKGRFTLRVPVSGNMDKYRYGMWLRANITVTALDGEAHDASTSLSLCSRHVRLSGTCARFINRYQPIGLSITAFDATEHEIDVPVRLQLFRGKELLDEVSFQSTQRVDLSFLTRREAGRYTWRAESVLEGDTATWNEEFLLCDERSNTLPVDTALWCYTPSEKFGPDQPAVVQIGSCFPDAYIYLSATADDHIVCDTTLCLNGVTNWTIPYEKRYGQALTIAMALVRDERMYSHATTLRLPLPETTLKYHWDTFRDHLRPGQQEQWTLSLTRQDGTPASASLMATMYDESLDVFGRHHLSANPNYSHHINYVAWHSANVYPEYARMALPMRLTKSFTWQPSSLNDRYFNVPIQETVYAGGSRRLYAVNKDASAAPMMLMSKAEAVTSDALYESVETTANQAEGALTEDAEAADEQTAGVAMRENFNETAFFFPSLVTNEQGQVAVRFTLPESLTRWHFMGYAHTRDMLTANIDAHATASKELMGELRLPRFLRQGDRACLTAIINNVSDKAQKGKATLTLLDAATQKVVLRKTENFDIVQEGEQVFTFLYDVPNSIGGLICRWQVLGTDCSDGEQRLLPILSDREWVEYTEALWLEHTGKQTIDLRGKFAAAKGDSLQVTVEYTTHPIWVALEALPAMACPYRNDAISLATAYYAVSTTLWALQEVPELKGDSTFLGNELTERKCNEWLSRLGALQNNDGSFSWYPGMKGSRYMTTEVAYLLARLQAQTGNTDAASLLNRAMSYLRNNTGKTLGYQELQQLYIEGLRGTKLTKAERKLLSEVDDEVVSWDRDSRALGAIVLMNAGEKAKAQRMFKTIERYLVSSPDKGTYIDYPEGSFSSIDRKIRRHTLMMEAVATVTPKDTVRLAAMRRWLLQQKRTQGWDTPMQCVDAVYALLRTSRTDLNDRQRDALTLRCGNRMMRLQADDNRHGYIRQTFDVRDVPSQLQVDKQSQGESWGAVYVRTKQQLDDVQASTTGLRVRCDMVQRAAILDVDTPLRRADLVTLRYTITADRDYEYVCLSAERPACCEPVDAQSSYCWSGGLWFYRQVRDSRSDIFIERLPRGTYVIEERVYLERDGEYSTGITHLKCEFAPEFQGHSQNRHVVVK